MDHRSIGSLRVSLAGLGCNNFGMRIDEARSREVVAAALDAGVTLFDTADLYGGGACEELLGRALGARRDDVVLATKFGFPWRGGSGGSAGYARASLEASLRRLGTDHIDLYYFHAPDPATPIAETLEALDAFVAEGKVREIGVSNVERRHLEEAARVADERGLRRFAVVENQYSLLCRVPEEQVLGACADQGMAFIPYFPLASGLLSGKYRKGRPLPEDSRLAWALRNRALGRPGDEEVRAELDRAVNWHPHERVRVDLDVVEALHDLARRHGRTPLQHALGWLAARPQVASVIVGATSPEQVRANAAATLAPLGADELDELSALTAGLTIPGQVPIAAARP